MIPRGLQWIRGLGRRDSSLRLSIQTIRDKGTSKISGVCPLRGERSGSDLIKNVEWNVTSVLRGSRRLLRGVFFEEALDALQVCSRFLWEAAHGFTSPFFRLDSYMSTKIYEQSCEKNPLSAPVMAL